MLLLGRTLAFASAVAAVALTASPVQAAVPSGHADVACRTASFHPGHRGVDRRCRDQGGWFC
ncbi:hypothetical protein GT039_28720 [Streptomyces sp. SID2955]|nr:hypothetical protein [Streptomyces sp. SID2955]